MQMYIMSPFTQQQFLYDQVYWNPYYILFNKWNKNYTFIQVICYFNVARKTINVIMLMRFYYIVFLMLFFYLITAPLC
jgi:hypothetical protein